jgi:hypothetical protein
MCICISSIFLVVLISDGHLQRNCQKDGAPTTSLYTSTRIENISAATVHGDITVSCNRLYIKF